MGAIAIGNNILVTNESIEIVVIGETGTVSAAELKVLVNNNSAYLTHEGDKLKLVTTVSTHNIYISIDDKLTRKIITLDRETGDWTCTSKTSGTIQTTPPTADGPDDGLLREVFLPLSSKGVEYLNYTYCYYID